mgnify:CR=1 FL=1
MSLMDFIKGELLEVIEWTDDSRDTLSYRFPDDDKAIKRGAQLIVRESQVAQFIHLGEFGDTFKPGKHTLTTDNIPVLTKLQSWKYGFESPFKADVYYVTTRLFTGNKWGTANPIMLRDKDFGIVRLRAFGTYDFKIVEPRVFLKEVAGSDFHFHLDEFSDTMRSRMVSVFSDAMASSGVPALDMATRYTELGDALLDLRAADLEARDLGTGLAALRHLRQHAQLGVLQCRHLDLQIGDLLGEALILDQRLAVLALGAGDVLQRLDAALGLRYGGDAQPLVGEQELGAGPALVLLADQVGDGDLDVVEEHLVQRAGALQNPVVLIHRHRPVVGVNEFEKRLRHKFLRSEPQHRAPGRAETAEAPVEIRDAKEIGRQLEVAV